MKRFVKHCLALALVGVLFISDARAAIIGNPIATVQSAAAESSHVLSNAPSDLYGIQVAIGTTAGYLMVFNATSAPADGAVTPALCFNVPASTTINYSPAYPVPFTTGIVGVFSTTGGFTKTASATAFFSGQVH